MQKLLTGWRQFRPFVLLYFVQGLVGGYLAMALRYYLEKGMGEDGFNIAEVGKFLATLALPWSYKFLAAPLLDAWVSWRRKAPKEGYFDWVKLANYFMLFGLLLLCFGFDAQVLMWAAFLVNSGRALQDLGTDALAIHLVHKDDQVEMQASVQMAAVLGFLLGGSAVVTLQEKGVLAWPDLTPWVLVLVLVLGLLLPAYFLSRFEKTHDSGAEEREAEVVDVVDPGLGAAAGISLGVLVLAGLLAVLAQISESFVDPVVFSWLIDELHYDGKIGRLLALATFMHIPGAWLGAWLMRIDRNWGVVVTIVLKSAVYGAIGLLSFLWGKDSLVLMFIVAMSVVESAMIVAFRSYFMGLSGTKAVATKFALLMSLMNLSVVWASWLGGVVGSVIPVADVFVLAGALQLLALIPLVFLWRKRA